MKSLSPVTMKTSSPALRGLARERADHVVGLEALDLEDRDAVGLDDRA